MYEYIKPKQTSDHKSDTSRNVTQRKTISFGDSYADRNTKMGFRPSPEKGSVIQRMLSRMKYTSYEKNNPNKAYRSTNRKESDLNSTKLREEMDAKGKGGEAHHIIPGCVVRRLRLAPRFGSETDFNKAWNGILLKGPGDKKGEFQEELEGDELNIFHRRGNQRNHPDYNRMVINLIGKNNVKDLNDCERIAGEIRGYIINQSSTAECLDDMNF